MMDFRSRKEWDCEDNFRRIGTLFNANTPEKHPVVFSTEDEFKAAMSILAVCAKLFHDVKLFAFQLMSNHLHLVVGGDADRIEEFFSYFVDRLDKHFEKSRDFSNFKLKLKPVEDLTYMRNAIAYVNRNGFVVNDGVTPFSYPWGSSMYFFQPVVVRYALTVGRPAGIVLIRSLMHTRSCDGFKDLKVVDGYVSPLEFCEIATAESVFRDAKQYFYNISKKVEAYADVAKSIGEALFYNDNDLFTAAVRLAKDNYGLNDLRTLPASAKLELAKRLHYDYNASEKQLQRLMNIDADLLKAML